MPSSIYAHSPSVIRRGGFAAARAAASAARAAAANACESLHAADSIGCDERQPQHTDGVLAARRLRCIADDIAERRCSVQPDSPNLPTVNYARQQPCQLN